MRVANKETKIQLILETSLNLFSSQGYQTTTMADIGGATGMARTTLYDYFKSKQDILFALLDQVLINQSSQAVATDPLQALWHLADGSLKRLIHHFDLYKILFTELPALDPSAHAQILKWQNTTLTVAKDAIDRGIKAGLFASDLSESDLLFAYQSLLSTKMSTLLYRPTTIEPAKEANQIMRLFTNGTLQEAIPICN